MNTNSLTLTKKGRGQEVFELEECLRPLPKSHVMYTTEKRYSVKGNALLLNIKSEQHHIPFLYHILFPFRAN